MLARETDKFLISVTFFCHSYRHTSSATGSDIDAAAMEFERRFHISVDESADREHQVCFKWSINDDAWTLSALFTWYSNLFLFTKMHVSK